MGGSRPDRLPPTLLSGALRVARARAVAQVPLLNIVTAAWSDGIELLVTAQARAG